MAIKSELRQLKTAFRTERSRNMNDGGKNGVFLCFSLGRRIGFEWYLQSVPDRSGMKRFSGWSEGGFGRGLHSALGYYVAATCPRAQEREGPQGSRGSLGFGNQPPIMFRTRYFDNTIWIRNYQFQSSLSVKLWFQKNGIKKITE